MRHDLPDPQAAPPWWRVGMVWLVIGGPLVVVVAGFVTLALAIRHPDPLLPREATPTAASAAQTPAIEARNHAATLGR